MKRESFTAHELFAWRLHRLRRASGRNQKEIAYELGITSSTLSNYETGKREPSLDTLVCLARYFSVSVEYLLGMTDAASPGDLEKKYFAVYYDHKLVYGMYV